MSEKIFATWMVWVGSLTTAMSGALKSRILKAWVYWTVSVIIATTVGFFYISAVRSIAGWSLAPLYVFFFYPLMWFVLIGISIFASTFGLLMTGWQEGFDKLPIVSPIFVAKETVMFPLWFPREVYQILRS